MHNRTNKSTYFPLLMLIAMLLSCLASPSGVLAESVQNEDSYAESDLGGYPGLGNPAFAGKPISLHSGSESFKRTDLTLGRFFPISVRRRYHSQSSYDSQLGYGWAHNYDKQLFTYSDGSVVIRKETGWRRKFIPTASGFTTPVGETGTLVANPDGTFTYTEKNGTAEQYDVNGRLASIVAPTGSSLVLTYESSTKSPLWGLLPWNVNQSTPLVVAYDYRLSSVLEKDATGAYTGTWVAFTYDPSTGRLTGIADSLGRSVAYGHDSIGNLTSVTTPLLAAAYAYTDPTNKHLMTSIDEGGGAYVNTGSTAGRVTRQAHGTGTIDFTYITPSKKTQITTTIKDSAGTVLNTQTRTVEFDGQGQPSTVTDTFGNQIRYTRNDRTWITREEHWENSGTVTAPVLALKTANDYTYDDKGNILTETRASGTAVSWTATYTYHPSFGKVLTKTVKSVVDPTQNRVTSNTYDAAGNITGTTDTGLLGNGTPYTYTSAYAYDVHGHLTMIDGPRTDVQDITTFTYDPVTGNRLSMTQPLIGTTTYANHDGLGNPGTITDPNGNTTTYTYDTVGRVLTIKAPGDTAATQYSYTTVGCASCGGAISKIDHITLPEGNTISYSYDAVGHLSTITDSLGNSINSSYDSEGNKLKEEIKDPTGILQKTISYQYDALNRLVKVVNPDSTFSQLGYDSLDNRMSAKDPKGNLTSYTYDTLSRTINTTQPANITTGFAYNSNNNLTNVTDGNNNATVYKYDDMGRVYQTISPDAGTTTYAYDPAGNLVSKTDASGTTITYSYDALNRLTTITFPSDPAITYSYDTCPNGKRRLCAVTDQSGTTYEYTKKGQIAKETRTIDSIAYVTQYTYDMNGNVKTITYPSGRVVTYSYTNDRVAGISSTFGGVTTTLANNITYKPVGGIAGLTYGNGLGRTIGYDNQYRPTSIVTGNLQNLAYCYDANANITAITNNLDNTKNKSYTYDAFDRLSSGTGPWGTISWTYDPVGNRLTQVDIAGTSSYSYQAGSNRLTSITGANPTSFSYDANGNAITENAKVYTYNQNQRLIRAAATQTGDYIYNASGQRVKKTVAGTTTVFHYDTGGRLIAETASDGTVQAEYVSLYSQPLAKIDANGTSYIHTDHLGTPVMMTDASGANVWEIERRPFGDAAGTTGTASLNLRFPGQYFDAETGLNYNYFRDYNPTTGKYVEADPIGLRGGINPFIYVSQNPTSNTDPFGLQSNGSKDQCREEAEAVYNKCIESIDKVEQGKTIACVASGIGTGIATGVKYGPVAGIASGIVITCGCFVPDWEGIAFPAGKAGCAQLRQRVYDNCKAGATL